MTVIREKFGNFAVMRRERTSGHVPTVDGLSVPKILRMFGDSASFKIYVPHYLRLTTFEIASHKLADLEVWTRDDVWSDILNNNGKGLIRAIHKMLYEYMQRHPDSSRAMVLMTPTGQIALATGGVVIPNEMGFPSAAFRDMNMNDWSNISDFYARIDTDGGAFIFDESYRPYVVWPIILDVLALLGGYPYSLYMDREPYVADFWIQVSVQMPRIYDRLARHSRIQIRDIRKPLLAANLDLVDHEPEKEVSASEPLAGSSIVVVGT